MNKSPKTINGVLKKINLYSAFLLVFGMPFYKPLLPYLSFLWAFTWLLDGGPLRLSKLFVKNKFLWFFVGFFLLYLVGMLFTENQNAGWFNLEVKLSLLFFPLIMSSLNSNYEGKEQTIFKIFIGANLIAGIVCIISAVVNYYFWNYNTFFYAKLSIFHHPTYYSMYIAFSLVLVLNNIFTEKASRNKIIIYTILIVVFLTLVFLLSSKAGIISAFLAVAGYLTIYLFNKRKFFSSFAIIIIAGLLFFAAMNLNQRFTAINKLSNSEKIDKNDEDSNVARLMIWKSALEVGMENLVPGVGTGDTKDVLMEKYLEKGLFNPLEKKYNAHNEFLETFVSLGFIGLLYILLLFAIPIIKAFRKKEFVALFFLLITGLNFCFESMLNTIAGVLFFSFFYSLLVFGGRRSEGRKV
ncbi:MAG: O-antigen ligase family protein [Bacteroidales bacterium]|nr:O-antigen ligase family protein [Bacteroidales bacterium]